MCFVMSLMPVPVLHPLIITARWSLAGDSSMAGVVWLSGRAPALLALVCACSDAAPRAFPFAATLARVSAWGEP